MDSIKILEQVGFKGENLQGIKSRVIEEILEKRGIIKKYDIEEFLSSKPRLTYDPFLLNNMEAGAGRIIKAIEDKEKICIYGDYDADGVTSTALLMEYLSHFKADVFYYIPSRFSEGYGLNKDALTDLKNLGVDLIVTVDCGSVSYDEVEHGKAIGLDFVITDHHDIGQVIADCIVISPKFKESSYPFKGLAGVGVAFKLAQALQRLQKAPKEYVNNLLDLVTIGTIGDIMPMLDENRTLVKYGLKKINSNPRLGLKKLIEETCINLECIKALDVSFRVVPYINAAGRMESADLAVKLLLERDEEEALRLAQELIENNANRRQVQDDSFKKCEKIIEKMDKEKPFLILECDDVHEGIAGIVAGKLKEKYYRPVMLVTTSDGEYFKGTSRSIKGLNLHKLLSNFDDLYERFGGHAGACGLLMKKENFKEFKERILKKAEELMWENPELFERHTAADIEVKVSDMDLDLVNEFENLEPFGKDFEKPVFAVRIKDMTQSRRLGDLSNHIKFYGVDDIGASISCIKFGADEAEMELVESGDSAVIFGNAEINEWRGNKTVQFKVANVIKEEAIRQIVI